MADTKITSNGNVDVWFVPLAGIVDPKSPTAAEINAGLRLTPAVAWDSTTFPNASESNQNDDRSLEDAGNATTRGYEQYEADLNFFYPKDLTDTTSDFGKIFDALRIPRVPGYLITRVIQRATAPATTPAAAGQWVSVFKVISDAIVNDTEGEDSYKYLVNFLPQGGIHVYTQVKNATPVVIGPLTLAVAVGGHGLLSATLGGKSITQGATWVSDDVTVATVSPNGVVTGVSAGTASITASHPAATGAAVPSVVTVA